MKRATLVVTVMLTMLIGFAAGVVLLKSRRGAPKMDNEGLTITRAKRFRFDLAKVLPPDNPRSVPLLRLLSATDDARHLQKLLLVSDMTSHDAKEFEVPILNGELIHLFRILAGHLYEAGAAFRQLERDCRSFLDEVLVANPGMFQDLKDVRSAFATSTTAYHHVFLKPFRDRVGFHYKPESLKEALTALTQANDLDGQVIVTEVAGIGRYSVADYVSAQVLIKILGCDPNDLLAALHDRMMQAIRLVDSLCQVVDIAFIHIIEGTQDAIKEIAEGEVRIHPEIVRARLLADQQREMNMQEPKRTSE